MTDMTITLNLKAQAGKNLKDVAANLEAELGRLFDENLVDPDDAVESWSMATKSE